MHKTTGEEENRLDNHCFGLIWNEIHSMYF